MPVGQKTEEPRPLCSPKHYLSELGKCISDILVDPYSWVLVLGLEAGLPSQDAVVGEVTVGTEA